MTPAEELFGILIVPNAIQLGDGRHRRTVGDDNRPRSGLLTKHVAGASVCNLSAEQTARQFDH